MPETEKRPAAQSTPKSNNRTNPEFEKKLTSISKQSGIVFSGKIAYQFIGFLSSVFLARILGAELLGKYRLGIVSVQILTIFSTLGFDRGLVRYIPIYSLEDLGKVKRLIQHSLTLSLLIAVIMGFILFQYSGVFAEQIFHEIELTPVLQTFAFYVPIVTLFGVFAASLRGLKRADIEAYNQYFVVPIIFIVLLAMIFIFNGLLHHVILARITSTFIALLIIGAFLFTRYNKIFTAHAQAYDLKNYMSYSIPLLLIGALYVLIGRIDILMIGYFMDSDQVGIYSVALNLAVLLIFALQAVNTAFAPNISELCQLKDWRNLESLLKVLTKWIFYISLFTFILLVILRAEILLVFGPSFVAGAVPLIIVASGQLTNAFAGSTGAVLLMTGKQKWEILNSFLIIIINIILNIILIPVYGLIGAAIATAFSLAFVNLLKLLETYKEFKIHPYNRKYIKGTIVLLSAGIVTYVFYQLFIFFDLNYLVTIVLVTIVYISLTALVFFKLQNDEDDQIVIDKFADKLRLRFLTAKK